MDIHQLMPVDQMLRSIMGVLVYLGHYFQALLYPSFGKLPAVCMV